MGQTTNFDDTSPIRYINGVMVLRTTKESWEDESRVNRGFSDDLEVITPLQRHKLRYIIRTP